MRAAFRNIVTLVFLAAATTAQAHPHVWVTMQSEVVYAADGKAVGVRHAWKFDDMFSAFAVQGLEAKDKAKPTREELAPLAEVNVTSLKDFDYFTNATADGKKVTFKDPAKGDYWLDYGDAVLTLHFLLPFTEPVRAKELVLDIYDPQIFIDFALAKDKPIALANAPSGCNATATPPRQMTFQESKRLAEIGADQKNTEMAWGANFANKLKVVCP